MSQNAVLAGVSPFFGRVANYWQGCQSIASNLVFLETAVVGRPADTCQAKNM